MTVASEEHLAPTAGADRLLVEVHSNPEMALKDGRQSITIPPSKLSRP